MKQTLLYIIVFSCMITSCEQKAIQKPKFKLEKYLDSIKNIDTLWQDNTALREDINKKIKVDLKDKINNGLFDDYPLFLERINECEGKYFLELDNYYYLKDYRNNPLKYNINSIKFDIVGEVEKGIAHKLKEKNMYKIKFKFNKYIDFSNNKDVCKYVLRSPFIGLNSGISAYNDFEFGTIGIKIDTLEVYTEPL